MENHRAGGKPIKNNKLPVKGDPKKRAENEQN